MACQPIEVIPSSSFQRDIGNLRKSCRSVDAVVCDILVKEICPDPLTGDAIRKFGGRVRKSRVPNPDRNQGKSGGFRLIYDWEPESRILCLLRLYDKKHLTDLAAAEIVKARANAGLK
jgi:mRNA-degrading endonuclease RelE of RelBE toxin-antitoxin system